MSGSNDSPHSLRTLAHDVQSGEISLDSILAQMRRKLGPALDANALIAHRFDGHHDRGNPGTGPLAGTTIVVKDCFDVAGYPTTCGSALFANAKPAARSAALVTAFESLGATVLGKANLHEFCWGVSSQNPTFGTVANPAHPGYVAGGSSGGNAAALALGFSDIGLGTDTGGSVRIPAACCGIYGYKPARASLPLAGCFPFAPSLDTAGLMAANLEYLIEAYSAVTGRTFEPTDLAGRRIGVLAETELLPALEKLGAIAVPFDLGWADVKNGSAIMKAEAIATHHLYYPARRDAYGKDLQQKLDNALAMPAGTADTARVAVRQWREQLAARLDVELVVSPTLGCPLPAVTAWEPDFREQFSVFTRPLNYLDWPALAIGNGQITGPNEALVLGAALALSMDPITVEVEKS